MDSMVQAISRSGSAFEGRLALLDAQAAARETGWPIVIHVRNESGVTRDRYGAIIARPSDISPFPLATNAAKIDYQPTHWKLEKVGLREECDAFILVAMQDFTDQGITFNELNIKLMTIDLGATTSESGGAEFEVKEKSRAVNVGNDFIYLSFGLTRRS